MKNDDRLKNIRESLLTVMREPHRWLLLVGTGTSVAMDTQLGMPALKDHLLTSISNDTNDWSTVADKLRNGIDLETALTGVNLTETLQTEIAKRTAAFVAQKDMAVRDDVLAGNKPWVGAPLLQQLMRGLSPTWPRLPVVTSNYDMLIEYACSKANIPYITGYHGGVLRRLEWKIARERMYRLSPFTMGGKRSNRTAPIPCVELMKLHGSINLFRCNSTGTFVENDVWAAGCPSEYTPMIAPPGDIKNKEALNFHSHLFGEALQAIDKATAFIVIGYGFRDNHIHQKILERVRNLKCPLIVLTRDPSTALEQLPSIGKSVWVITGAKDQDNGKTDLTGTRFVNDNKELSGDFDGVALWQSDVFAHQILGG